MRSPILSLLLAVAAPLAAQPVLHQGDHVWFRGMSPRERYEVRTGVVEAAGQDSATVLFRSGCSAPEQRTVAISQLTVRVAGGRQTVPYAISGAMSAWMFGKLAAHVVVHNGGGEDGARAVRRGFALLIPFSAVEGYRKRTPRWIPVGAQTPQTAHLHVAPEDDYTRRACDRQARAIAGGR